MQTTEVLPVIDLNTLTSSEYSSTVILPEKEELVNNATVDIASQIISAIKEGFINPLEFAVKKKLVVDALDMAMKDSDVKKIIIEEVEKCGKQGASALGARITLTERPAYKYAEDPIWASMKAGIAEQEEAIKAQEKKIQAAVKNGGSIMDDDGVIIASVVPAPVTTSVNVSFKKK